MLASRLGFGFARRNQDFDILTIVLLRQEHGVAQAPRDQKKKGSLYVLKYFLQGPYMFVFHNKKNDKDSTLNTLLI